MANSLAEISAKLDTIIKLLEEINDRDASEVRFAELKAKRQDEVMQRMAGHTFAIGPF